MNSSEEKVSNLGRKNKGKFYVVVFTSVILLLMSVFGLVYVKKSTDEIKRFEFERTADQMVALMEGKIDTTVNLLYGLRALATEPNTSSQKWNDYLLAADIEKRFEGMYSVGYAERVLNGLVGIFEADVKKTEANNPRYDNYFVFPKSDNKYYFPLKYLHANDKDISILLGFDLGFADEITTALEQSVETGEPKMSEIMPLSTVIPSSNQEGYLLLLPVYSVNAIEELPAADRSKYVTGLVGAWLSPLTMLGGGRLKEFQLTVVDNGKVVFTSLGAGEPRDGMKVEKTMRLLNKEFSVEFLAVDEFMQGSLERNLPTIAAVAIIFFNLLWYATAYLFLTSGAKAYRLAREATFDLTKFKQAVEGVSDHVVITNVGGVIIYANKAAEKTTGFTVDEMIGRTPSLWGKHMGKEYYENFWKTIKEDKKTFVGQVTNKKKNGQTYEVEITVSPIMDENGDLQYFLGIERDITKQKAVERMKTEFISLASHQLRTPLSAVKWFGKMLADGEAGPLTDLQGQYLARINESNEREIRLVNALLNVSRIESGRITVEPKPTDMKKLVGGVVSEVRLGTDGAKRDIEWEVEDDVPEMNIDPDLIRHVYINLLTNAVRYTEEGGRIELRVSIRAGELVSEVRDDGIGIPDEEQHRLFEKFFRASNAIKKETDGNGLGLFLARTTIESSGGKIGFESKEGSGTTFWFTLPLSGMKKKRGELSMV